MAKDVSFLLMLIGSFFTFVAALGVARLPDLFTRMHSSTKSATLGASCLLLGVALWSADFAVWVRALAAVVFLFATAPVAAHMVGRSAYFSGVPLWSGTLSDELCGQYDICGHLLAGLKETPGEGAKENRPS